MTVNCTLLIQQSQSVLCCVTESPAVFFCYLTPGAAQGCARSCCANPVAALPSPPTGPAKLGTLRTALAARSAQLHQLLLHSKNTWQILTHWGFKSYVPHCKGKFTPYPHLFIACQCILRYETFLQNFLYFVSLNSIQHYISIPHTLKPFLVYLPLSLWILLYYLKISLKGKKKKVLQVIRLHQDNNSFVPPHKRHKKEYFLMFFFECLLW